MLHGLGRTNMALWEKIENRSSQSMAEFIKSHGLPFDRAGEPLDELQQRGMNLSQRLEFVETWRWKCDGEA